MSDFPIFRQAISDSFRHLLEAAKSMLKGCQELTSGITQKHLAELRASIESAIARAKDDMAIKLSELKGEVSAIRVQVGKIWGEQQKKYDDLLAKFTELESTLAKAELDEETTAEVVAFKAELQAFDDTIPDTTV